MSKKPNYGKYSDEQLLEMIHTGNGSAEEELYARYKPVVRGKARTYYLVGGDSEDIIQEGMIGLYKAICDFDPAKHSGFKSFANLCITRHIQTVVKLSMRKKHSPLNNYVSFEQTMDSTEDSDLSLADLLTGSEDDNPENQIISREQSEVIFREIQTKLSSMERDVLSLYVKGFSYQQIAQMMNKAPKSIDNALTRIKKKLSAFFEA